jgi:pimeloyl-ACP methyl ester carboxylesterase
MPGVYTRGAEFHVDEAPCVPADKEGDVNHDSDARFRWLERGEGEPVVLLHGLMGHMDHWDGALDALAATARVLAPELPLFEPSFSDLSIASLASHVCRFLDALDVERAVVGGNSLGGHVALELALTHPDRVNGLVLTGSSGLFERSFTRGVPHRPTTQFVREKMEEVFHDAALVTDEWVESVRRTVTTRTSALRVLKVARAARVRNVETLLHTIAVPTLLVWGKEDRVTPPDIAERFHRLIPRAALVFIPSCGHAPMLEQPDAFNTIVESWLSDTRPLRTISTGLVVTR